MEHCFCCVKVANRNFLALTVGGGSVNDLNIIKGGGVGGVVHRM